MIIWSPKSSPGGKPESGSRGKRGGARPEPRGPMATRRSAQSEASGWRARAGALLPFLPALAGVLIGLSLIGAGWLALRQLPSLPVRALSVQGALTRVDTEAIRVNALPPGADVLAVDLQEVRARVKALPWVREAQVRRLPPDTLEITVEEHQPLALWQEGERLRLVSQKSEVFDAEHDLKLPLLSGPAGTAPIVVAEAQRFANALGEVPAEVRLSERRAWMVKLADGTRLELGREETLPRLERFMRVRQEVAALQRGGLRVDLRYPAGLAVQKTPEMLQFEKEQANRKKKA